MSFFQNTCKPYGFGGKLMVKGMNTGHSKLHKWGFEHLSIKDNAVCLDIGCGGGTNLKRILKMSDKTKAYGIDYSYISVDASNKKCHKEVKEGRCYVKQMNVLDLCFGDIDFDLITAFETIYFWGDLDHAFQNVYDCLKDGGQFFICNESNGKNKSQEGWCHIIDGMKIYTIPTIKKALENAGFKNIEIDDTHKSWLAILATK